MNINNKNVLIIGSPKSGKTTLAKKLKTKNHLLICTDHFLRYNSNDALIQLIDVINHFKNKTNILVEGTLGYRLLRKIQEENLNIKFDIILNVNRDVELNEGQQRLHKGNLNILNSLNNITITNYND
jgi:adenylate kinase family enzyme